jgi:hypothetical protein
MSALCFLQYVFRCDLADLVLSATKGNDSTITSVSGALMESQFIDLQRKRTKRVSHGVPELSSDPQLFLSFSPELKMGQVR